MLVRAPRPGRANVGHVLARIGQEVHRLGTEELIIVGSATQRPPSLPATLTSNTP